MMKRLVTGRLGRALSGAMMGATVIAALSLAAPGTAVAQGAIRDAEIEATIRDFATPLFSAAGLNPDAVDIYIRKDDQINAFVAGGQNLFLNTGFLLETRSASEVIGVVAHETGHIAGGHLARTSDILANASRTALIAQILGIVAAVGSGNPGAGVAVATGGTGVAERALLSYSRTQESSADQAALRYLDATGQTAQGLVDFLGTLEDQELLSAARRSPYLSTHPLTRDRIATAREHLRTSPYRDAEPTAEQKARYDRMIAKLYAFLRAPGRTFSKYPKSDQSVPARYARAVAYHEAHEVPQSLREVDGLIADHPDDPFFHELRGQILFENGRPGDALPSYRRAVELLPGNGLLEISLARVLLTFNDPNADAEALQLAENAIDDENDWGFAWQQVAIAHGRLGNFGESALALAEKELRYQNYREAEQQARRAQSQLSQGSPSALRALDIEELAKREISRREN